MGDRVRRTEVDGVPVFYTEEPARPIAALLFRVGRGDEPFLQAGTSHLVEHLAFHQLGELRFPVNGFVDHVRTVFHAAGRADENARFLTDVVGALGRPDGDRIAQEMHVLRVEASRRASNPVDVLLIYRYGAETLGRAAAAEHALHRATAADVEAWTATWFTAGNAVAWMSSPPPAGFRLALPPGERRPPAARREIDPLPLPSWGRAPVGGVAIGAPIARTAAGSAMGRVLRTRVERRLRRELGLSYEISLVYQPLDGADAHVAIYASCRDQEVARVAAEVVAVVEELAKHGATEEELAEDVDAMVRSFADPDAVLGELARSADTELLGHPHDTPEQLEAEARALTPPDTAAAAEQFASRAIAIGNGSPSLPQRWKPYPMWSTAAVAGRVYDHVKKRYPWTKGTTSLVVASDGLSLVQPDGRAVTVRYGACSGVIRLSSTIRTLIGSDGFQVRVDAAEWKGGSTVIDVIDSHVPPDAQVAWQD